MKRQGEQHGQGRQVFSTNGNQCVWMKAGVINFKTCDNAFDCTSCPFDKEISGKAAREATAPISWRAVMGQPHLHKECRHMLTGRVLFKLCAHNYECKDCAYDQQLYEYDQLMNEENLPASEIQVDNIPGFMGSLVENYCSI
jgi:hypothetical protein